MGAGESTPVVETIVENVSEQNQDEPSDSGAESAVNNESKTMTQDEVMSAMESVVAHEYGRMQELLTASAKQHLSEAQQMSDNLKSKFGTPSGGNAEKCGDEKQVLLACLNENKDSPLVCQELSDAYSACSLNAIGGHF